MRRSRFQRRQLLQAGLLGSGLLTLPELMRFRAATAETAPPRRAKACIFIFLFGGPSHLDLWDMKPQAPREIRGEFQPIDTSVPGIQLCEHLPQLAQQMDKFCLLRSMTHRMNVHGPACSEIYTGRPYFGPPVTDQATPQDWPSVAALVNRYGRSPAGLPPSVVLPWYAQFVGQDKRIAGQTGGRMGEEFNPFLVEGDPTQPDFRVNGLELPADITTRRLQDRRRLREQIDPAPTAAAPRRMDDYYAAAFHTLERAESAGAFDLQREPRAVREKFGWTKFGQSLVAARRLVEAGVPLVTVNWSDNTGADKVSPHWDTHHDNFNKLRNDLCPPFDVAFAAFLQDLHERGLLDTTMIAVSGEFGRTPRIGLITQNGMTQVTGRDHWPHAFTVLLAGGGIRGGQVYGATNNTGGYVADNPVTPADLSATILTHLGIDPHHEYHDQFQRIPQQLSEGLVIKGLSRSGL